jgi:hypothetical protein
MEVDRQNRISLKLAEEDEATPAEAPAAVDAAGDGDSDGEGS